MVSTLDLEEKYNRVRKNYCFYLDIQDHGLARSISRRIQDIGLQQEVFLTSRVSHVVRDRGAGATPAPCERAAPPAPARRERRRADAMLESVRRAQPPPPPPEQHRYVVLTVQKAISLLDKLYDTFFAASRKSHVRLFTKHYIKIEFLDKWCRPIYKEFDEWPTIQVDAPKEKTEQTDDTSPHAAKIRKITAGQKMTKGRRPRIKEKEEKEPKGGYCEMCNMEYADASAHQRSSHHMAFVRDTNNYIALDSLITAGGDVATFLDKTAINGERRSQRICNDEARTTRSKRSQSPDSTVGDRSPRRNGLDSKKCAKKTDDRQYYKVVGVSTKLRSSGGFAKRKDSPPTCNGAKPLVVKFRKVRRSELSVLSDEAEQFMFPKRASSTSSTSSDEEDKVLSPKRKSPAVIQPPLSLERRRQARPLALKEESSEDDSWPEDKRRRKRRGPPVSKRPKRTPCKTLTLELPVEPDPKPEEVPVETPKEETPVETPVETPKEVSPLREEVEKCMKWEDGRLKYTPAVEQLEFAFESVPQSEPWYETFKRQDQDKVVTRNVPQYFALYSSPAPKLPYEMSALPPLKPNCCPLSELNKREDRTGPARAIPTRMHKQRMRKRTAALIALETHPRKSPREHASTLAILGSAGLLNRKRLADDTKSTASEDTVSETHSNLKMEPLLSETQEASERLQQFLSEVFDDASDYDVSDEAIEGEPVTTSTTAPDVSSLVSECDECNLITDEIKAAADRPKGRRGKFKKKNRTGWPNKKKVKKDSRAASVESDHKTESMDRSSAEPGDDTVSEADTCASDADLNNTAIDKYKSDESRDNDKTLTEDTVSQGAMDVDSSDKLLIDLKVVVDDSKEAKEEKKVRRKSRSSGSDEDLKKKRRTLQGLCDWLPVVRVARVDTQSARRLRSAARPRSQRLR